ncbi:MAG: sigma 54-interacting transcriptional regulator [Candidatus Latescibacterota bacterium]
MADERKKNPPKAKKKSIAIFNEMDELIQAPPVSSETQEDLRKQIKELESSRSIFQALLNISASINSTLNQRELLQKIVDAVILSTDCDRGFLMLRKDKGHYSFEISRSRDQKELTEDVFKVSRSIVEKAAESGEPVPLEDIQKSKHFRAKDSVMALNLASAYAVPLKYEDKLVGIIYVDSERMSQRFTGADLSILKAFGAQAAVAIENARRRNELELSVMKLQKKLAGQYEFSGIIGKSQALREVIDRVKKVAAFPTTVFLQGESGVGKGLIASAIHYNSNRKDGVFTQINCGSLPETLLEGTLFGYVKGAFTGADKDTPGAFETTNGGTIFLDEITELRGNGQSSLLRVLEEGEVMRLGDAKGRKVDVRVISATNRDLAKEVAEGRFREDLFYRLNVVPIKIPPLRDRIDDLIVLAEHYLGEFGQIRNFKDAKFTKDAIDLMRMYRWPGNVRELKNLIERVVVLEGENCVIDANVIENNLDNYKEGIGTGEGNSLKEKLDAAEAEILRKTLILHSNNISKAAKELKISRQSLHGKIKKYRLSDS